MSKALATKNVAAALIGLGLVFAFAFSFATSANAQTTTSSNSSTLAQLQAQVQALLAQIAALQGGSSSTTTSTGGACTATFTQNLTTGSTGAQVMALQKFLNDHGAVIAATGAGSPGNETSYFGGLTKAAVIKWQNANAASVLTPVGLSAGTGYWGPSSRAYANQVCSSSTGTGTGTGTGGTTTPTGAGITITAGAQPANSLAPQNASRVPFTTFTLTNNSGSAVTISGIQVQRTGLAQDAAFSGVELVDAQGMQIGIARTFNSNHQATIGDTFTLQAGQSMTYTVAGNMGSSLSAYSGQVAGISVIGVNTTVPVSGSLPITGAQQTINSTLSIGTVTANTSSFDPNSAQTKNIGDTGVKFSAIRLTAGSAEDVKLYSVRFRMNGSASQNDLSNLAIVVNGTSYPATWSTDGRYVSATFPGGVLIQKGNSADVVIQGDVSGSNAAGRVVEFDVDKASDVYLVGQTYGYGITPVAGSAGTLSTAATHGSTYSSSQPWFQGSTISIESGTPTTIQNATSVAAQNVAVNVPNQPLGGFTTNFAGEPVTVQQMVFNVATSSGAKGLTNVTVVDQNGNVVAGPVDEVFSSSGAGTLTFNDSVTFPTGSATYTLKGTVESGSTNGSTYQLSTTPSSGWTNVTGETTGNTISLSGFSTVTMNTMTVQGLSLTVAASASPASQTIVAGGQSVLFANIQLDASASGEDVRINAVPLELTSGGKSSVNDLSSCQLYDSNGNALNYGTNIINSSSISTSSAITFSLNNSLTISKGTVDTLALKCNVSASTQTGATFQFGTKNTDSMTVYGTSSGNSTTVNPATSNSGTMTVSTGGLTMGVDASSPNFTLASGGTTGVTVGVYKFHPTAEAMTLQKIGVYLSSGNVGDVSQLYFYNSAGTQIGTAVFTGTSQYATSTLSSQLSLPADQDTLVTVKANLADIGTGQAGTEGDLIKVDPSSAQAVGQASGSTQLTGTTASVAGVRAYNTFPTVAQDTLASTGMADGNLLRFKVTADSHGNVGIDKFSFSMATTSPAAVTAVKLYGYSDSSYTTPISSGADTSGQIGSTYTPASSAPSFSISPTSNPVEVPAGQTYYFALKGTVTAGTNASVVTTLQGDTTASPSTGTTNVAGITGNYIWSPNATTTVSLSGNDWTNGYGVTGLGSGFSQARSN